MKGKKFFWELNYQLSFLKDQTSMAGELKEEIQACTKFVKAGNKLINSGARFVNRIAKEKMMGSGQEQIYKDKLTKMCQRHKGLLCKKTLTRLTQIMVPKKGKCDILNVIYKRTDTGYNDQSFYLGNPSSIAQASENLNWVMEEGI